MELMRAGMELEARQNELAHEQNLRELELEERRVEIDRLRRRVHGGHKPGGRGLVVLLVIALHILLTVWVRKDMCERGIGRKLWVPIVLIGGLLAAILYAIVRLDARPAE